MRVEQKIVMVYTILGLLSGFLTNYSHGVGLWLEVAIVAPFSLYFISLPFLAAIVRKKKTTVFYNSFLTFLLVWLTVWILLFNLGV